MKKYKSFIVWFDKNFFDIRRNFILHYRLDEDAFQDAYVDTLFEIGNKRYSSDKYFCMFEKRYIANLKKNIHEKYVLYHPKSVDFFDMCLL